ncbi:MAG: sensor domain-containing diguanylate cyclase [Candidatus Omnitrophota bacterium]
MTEEIQKLQLEINKTRTELSILYEISNAMRTTLNLDEILYIILTGVTAHVGLGFNRAMLFLVNEKENILEGKMGIGPDTADDAGHIWSRIEHEKMDLEDLIGAYKSSDRLLEFQFNRTVTSLKIPLKENGNLLSLAVHDGMPLHVTKEMIHQYPHDQILNILKNDELAIIPLKAKDKVNGVILADNIFTKRPITKDEMRMLIMLANQAGLAIENSRLYEYTLKKAHTDSLTGLINHGRFQYLFQEELNKAKAIEKPLSLIMIDIDNFKNYNDTLGHQAGDQILEKLAVILKDYSRKKDFVCRYGGEEFVDILPETSKQEAINIAERLRQAIEQHHFAHEEIQPDNKLTISIGVASFPQDGKTKNELLNFCDKMLYKAKESGKNRVYY